MSSVVLTMIAEEMEAKEKNAGGTKWEKVCTQAVACGNPCPFPKYEVGET
jgi:hypothetical protein